MALPISESYCIGCGRVYGIESFFKSPNSMHCNGVVPYCKECNKRIAKKYLKEYQNLESAIWLTCAEVGVPFIRKVFAGVEELASKAKNKKSCKEIDEKCNWSTAKSLCEGGGGCL